ncbi:ABC transporter ATP-binding protein [Bifidobacterium angulatum]|uniref:ABC transporter, ATP-binding protein n=1 Tax=Bifidobacterium angulatum DSM 20098 = JCM 7096 TaxID=518635 RepID=C4FFZ2_9BIFI|nr:ABC transporter ATP-binding protein [Bifidobacterium angulatum]EEP20688.1 ABC transporter, ATP-binding protein [Bifidobacterium angulatum DSM 20098 = JCM 7096]KFI41172.1 ABC-type proline/glycine betaine transport system [Bifidobacterium angulatum]BAQ96742.1 putative ABC transporter ATP-binding component [Bifidobacterium angulatum DSM 20098 = JCM 7096]
MNTTDIIKVNDLTFGYKRKQAVLEHITFAVPKGQSLAILGYNGVGKTTLFDLIVGLRRPWSGYAAINKAFVPSMRDVFQMTEQGGLIDTMTVRENFKFRKMLFKPKDDDKTFFEALEKNPLVRAFELNDQLDKKVSDLSSGLRKRVGIVAGMMFDPHVIMLDEPTNAIDPLTRDLLIEYMGRLRADNRTILTITHDLHYCWNVSDRIIVLDHKHIALDAMLSDLNSFDEFSKAAMLGKEHGHVDFGL